MARTAVLGLPRIGPDRELKFALEGSGPGAAAPRSSKRPRRELRARRLGAARAAGIDVIPSGDFSLYDHVLDTAWALGAIPSRFGDVDRDDLAPTSAARGTAARRAAGDDEVVRHQLPLPRARSSRAGQAFSCAPSTGPARCGRRRRWASRPARSCSARQLPRCWRRGSSARSTLLDRSSRSTRSCCASCARPGATEVQLDEPCLALDRTAPSSTLRRGVRGAERGADSTSCLATYFAPVDPLVSSRCPSAELHLDLVRAPGQLAAALDDASGPRSRSACIDGRNVWAADLDLALDRIDAATAALGCERVTIAPSCSLLHVPYDGGARDGGRPGDPAVAGVRAREARRAAHARRGRRRRASAATCCSPAPAKRSARAAPRRSPTTRPSAAARVR